MNRLKTLFTIFTTIIFLIINLCTPSFAEKKPTGITLSPAELQIIEGKNNYTTKITNNYEEQKEFDISVSKYDQLKPELVNSLDITKYITLDTTHISLAPGASHIINITLSSEIHEIKTSLYGKLIIVNKNNPKEQATLNSGFAIDIKRELNSDLNTQSINIKNINFKKDFFSLKNTAEITFDLENTGSRINKIYGEIYIKNNTGEIIFHRAISDYNLILLPSEIKSITENTTFEDFYNTYTLYINLIDSDGNIYARETKELRYISSYAGLIAIGIIIVLIIVIINRKKILNLFSKILRPKKHPAAKIVQILIISIVLCSSFVSPITTVFAAYCSGNANSGCMDSNSYMITDSDFTGGNKSGSTSYELKDGIGSTLQGTAGSTNYATTIGGVPLYIASVPKAPTVSNNSNLYYDRLAVTLDPDVIDRTKAGGNPSDTEFALIVTSSSFPSVTKYVTGSNTLANTPAASPYSPADNDTGWRKYNTGGSNWGGPTGVLVTGLAANTDYTFYLKARHRYSSTNIPASESEIVLSGANQTPNTTGTTAAATITLQIIGVTTSDPPTDGITNDINTTSSAVNFGTLTANIPKTGSNLVRVNSNAINGYKVTLSANQKLQKGSDVIDFFTASSANCSTPDPKLWASPTGTVGWIGFHTSDIAAYKSGPDRYFAPFPISPTACYIIDTSATQDGTNKDTGVTYRIEVPGGQPAGSYSGMTITYLVTGTF